MTEEVDMQPSSGADRHQPERSPSLDELVRAQGVRPIRSIEDVRGTCWPADEAPEDFERWLRRQRQDRPRPEPR